MTRPPPPPQPPPRPDRDADPAARGGGGVGVARPAATDRKTAPSVAPAAAPGAGRAPLLRKIEIACLGADGAVVETSRLVPAQPAFEDAFAAFARGTLFAADRGIVAVEDLWPGDRVKLADGGFATLLWRGATMIVPAAGGQDPAMTRLLRIAADALGIARPMQDLVLGPHARVVQHSPGIRALTGRDAALVPAVDLVDGVNVVEIAPPAPVAVFHLAFAQHQRLVANGVEVESFHPGPAPGFALRGEALALWLACFPHLDDLEGFGPCALPRLRLRDLGLFDVA